MIRSIIWFRQDLRLHDNEALVEAIRNSDELLPVFIFDNRQFHPETQYHTPKTGMARTIFMIDAIKDLRQHLKHLGSNLIVRTGITQDVLFGLASQHKIHYIYCNRERTKEEVDIQDELEKKLWTIGCEIRYSRGKMLYYTSDLPFPVTHCPDSFVVFKKEIDQAIPVRKPLDTPVVIPFIPANVDEGDIPVVHELLSDSAPRQISIFKGGETEGLKALAGNVKMASESMATEGSGLSPWIALGCLSPKKVYFEARGQIEDVQHHLLYRDYLRLMGKKYGDQIFHKSGIKDLKIHYRHSPTALASWQQGNTGIAIIDAGMRQLNHTGWIPDAIRRILAGYFIKVLNLDWRLGAAYFESRLVDYDPCTNWVSWLNMAGLGPDSREDRIINYDAVGKRMDPDGRYVSSWLTQPAG